MDELSMLEEWAKKSKKPFGLDLDFGAIGDASRMPAGEASGKYVRFPGPPPVAPGSVAPPINIEPIKSVVDSTLNIVQQKGKAADEQIGQTLQTKRPSWEEIQAMLDEKDEPMNSKELMGGALLATLPTLLGGILGGTAGAAGASQGAVTGAQMFVDQRAKDAQRKRDGKLKAAEFRIKAADQEADDAYKKAKLIFDRFNAEVSMFGKASEQTTAALREILKMENEQSFKTGEREATQEFTAEQNDKKAKNQIDLKKTTAGGKGGSGGPKAPKPDQLKAGGFARRLEQAEAVFGELTKSGYNRASRKEELRKNLPEEMQGENLRKQDQAERNFLNAVLRRESGAAIGVDEFSSGVAQYFPRPGDTTQLLAQKRANRLQAFENLKAEAGSGFDAIRQVGTGTTKPTKPIKEMTRAEKIEAIKAAKAARGE
jgi:hypothetical protein